MSTCREVLFGGGGGGSMQLGEPQLIMIDNVHIIMMTLHHRNLTGRTLIRKNTILHN